MNAAIDPLERAPEEVIGATASGLRLHAFGDGSAMVAKDNNAVHLSPDDHTALRRFVRVFDQSEAPTTLLTEAAALIYGDREQTHGEPSKNLECIAAIWTAELRALLKPEASITPQLVCLMMIGLKLARAVNRPRHREHWLDAIGYAALGERCGYVDPPKAAEAAEAALRG